MNPAMAAKGLDEKYCSECGEVIKQKAEICPRCGVRQMQAPLASAFGRSTPSGRNRIVAALMAIFLGMFGLHKFYLGQTAQGFLYLVFFWTFIPAILGFVDAIRLLLMSDENFAMEYEKP